MTSTGTARGKAISAAGASDAGRVRADNEDRFYVDVERGIYLVADGVGGHAAGEVAATIACDVIVRRLERLTGSPAQRVREAITLANNEIVRQAASSPAYAGMTCVVTLAVVDGDGLTIGHVGDSRLYLLTPRGIAKLTHDHSPVGEREDAQEISELDAMRHPRRNEVFRDVGSARHEPDDPDFIEIIQTRFEEDSAILLCSDGLSDMLATTVIENTVRQRAGDPATVAQALIDAANDAGGADNVTAVYVEGRRFAESAGMEADLAPKTTDSRRVRRWSWLASGVLIGIAVGLGVPYVLSVVPLDFVRLPRPPRALVVGGAGSDHFDTVGAALRVARAGDTVQLEPGAYPEALVLPPGVDLAAKEPGTAVLIAPHSRPDWVGLTVRGRGGNRVSGLRVRGQPDAPMLAGVQLAGDNIVVDNVEIEGTIGVGVVVEGDGRILIRGSRFSELTGMPVRIGANARPMIRQSLFLRHGNGDVPTIELAADAAPELVDNVLVGYSERVRAPAEKWTPARVEQLFRGNYRIRTTDSR